MRVVNKSSLPLIANGFIIALALSLRNGFSRGSIAALTMLGAFLVIATFDAVLAARDDR
jgi:uncharacterized membrane protein YraQ (UPF0718 family)